MSEKIKCPYCGKSYKNVNSHIKRMHPDEKTVSKSGSSRSKKSNTDSLEDAVAAKFMSRNKSKSEITKTKKMTMDDAVDSEKKGGFFSKKKKKGKRSFDFEKVVEVDYWLTNLHGAEVGVYQKERFMAKNRMFNRNLELVGAVKEPGKVEGMFAYNSDCWDDIPLKELAKKRLVIKWFNSQSIGYLGGIEEMVIQSMTSSIGASDYLPAFKIMVPRYKMIINLQKEHTRLPKIGEIFSFSMKDKKTGFWKIYTFDEKRFTVGSDWEILEGEDRIVGMINEKKLNIGGKYKVSFYDKKLYKDKTFFTVVILFTMMLKFKDEIKEQIEKIEQLMKEGKIDLKPSTQEEKFMMNPRAIRR